MKTLFLATILAALSCTSCATTPRWDTDDPEGIRYFDTVAKGLRCKWSGLFVDEFGVPMSNFPVRIAFERGNGDWQDVQGKTDQSGVFTAIGNPVTRVIVATDTNEYYRSFTTHDFFHYKDFSNIDGDRWLPWNMTNKIVVRPKRNPVKMLTSLATFRVTNHLPPIPLNQPIGLDCAEFEWMPPFGNGHTPDFTVEISSTVDGTNTLRLAAVDDGGGFIVKPVLLEGGSRFVTEYEAPEDGYSPTFTLSEHWIDVRPWSGTYFHQWCSMENPQYLVFRSRVLKDDAGQITNATHGIMFADANRMVNYKAQRCFESIRWLGDENGQRTNALFDVEYRFNPDPASRSIEWDGYEFWSGSGTR